MAERDARADIYTEVKAAGLKPKMVRKIVKERNAKAVDEAEEAELDLYRHALGMPGATYRSVAAQFGTSKSTLHRLVPRTKNGTEPGHDPEAGEILAESDAALSDEQIARMRALAAAGDRAHAIRQLQNVMPTPTAWQEVTASREDHEARKQAERDEARERRRAAERRLAEFNARVDADPLTIPPHLDRRARADA